MQVRHSSTEAMTHGMHTRVQTVDNKVSHAFKLQPCTGFEGEQAAWQDRFCHSAGDEEEYQQHQHRRPGEEELQRPSGARRYRVHKEDQEPGETSGARLYR